MGNKSGHHHSRSPSSPWSVSSSSSHLGNLSEEQVAEIFAAYDTHHYGHITEEQITPLLQEFAKAVNAQYDEKEASRIHAMFHTPQGRISRSDFEKILAEAAATYHVSLTSGVLKELNAEHADAVAAHLQADMELPLSVAKAVQLSSLGHFTGDVVTARVLLRRAAESKDPATLFGKLPADLLDETARFAAWTEHLQIEEARISGSWHHTVGRMADGICAFGPYVGTPVPRPPPEELSLSGYVSYCLHLIDTGALCWASAPCLDAGYHHIRALPTGLIVTHVAGKAIHVWAPPARDPVHTLPPSSLLATSSSFICGVSPDGRELRLWDTAPGIDSTPILREQKARSRNILDLAFEYPFIVTRDDTHASVWSLQDRDQLAHKMDLVIGYPGKPSLSGGRLILNDALGWAIYDLRSESKIYLQQAFSDQHRTLRPHSVTVHEDGILVMWGDSHFLVYAVADISCGTSSLRPAGSFLTAIHSSSAPRRVGIFGRSFLAVARQGGEFSFFALDSNRTLLEDRGHGDVSDFQLLSGGMLTTGGWGTRNVTAGWIKAWTFGRSYALPSKETLMEYGQI